ncbi:UNVERIFIED_CONTAM: hypothetical protein NCL1_07127 [Trichonephila clavipes]
MESSFYGVVLPICDLAFLESEVDFFQSHSPVVHSEEVLHVREICHFVETEDFPRWKENL